MRRCAGLWYTKENEKSLVSREGKQMKELFGVNVTEDSGNRERDGAGAASAVSYVSAAEDLRPAERPAAEAMLPPLPAWARTATLILSIAFVLLTGHLVQTKGNPQPGRWALVILDILLAAACIAVRVVARSKELRAMNRKEDGEKALRLRETAKEGMEQMDVPENAPEIDLFTYRYRTKNGENEACDQTAGQYIPLIGTVFCENGVLSVADAEMRFDIPVTDILDLKIVHQRVSMSGWYKEEACDQGRYRAWRLREDNMGRVWMDRWGKLTVRLNGEEYALRFPPYEYETIASLAAQKKRQDGQDPSGESFP